MNVHINKGNNNHNCKRKVTLEVHLGFSKKEIGDARTVKILTLNGELFVINVNTPKEMNRILIIEEVVLITESLEEVVIDTIKMFQVHIKEDIMAIIGMKVVVIITEIVIQVQ
jgi:hypothetical protein